MIPRRTAAEFRKFLARKSIVALLGLAVGMTLLTYWAADNQVRSWRTDLRVAEASVEAALERGDIEEDVAREELKRARQEELLIAIDARLLAFPRSIQLGFQSLATVGSLFVVLAAALAFGSEFGWGTYRNSLSLVRTREALLATQFVGFVLVAVLCIPVMTLISGTIGLTFHGVELEGAWGALASALGGTILSFGLWAGVGLLAAVVTRSASLAVVLSTVLWVGVYLASVFAPALRQWNVDTMTASLLVVDSSRFLTGLFLPAGISPSDPGPLRSAITLGFIGLASWLIATLRFRKAEIR